MALECDWPLRAGQSPPSNGLKRSWSRLQAVFLPPEGGIASQKQKLRKPYITYQAAVS